MVRKTLCIDDPVLRFTGEHSLDLLEDGGELRLWCLKQTELPCRWLTPEHGALGETFPAESVLSHGDVVISFNTIDLAPEVECLEIHA